MSQKVSTFETVFVVEIFEENVAKYGSLTIGYFPMIDYI